MMEKYLVTIEFRYSKAPTSEWQSTHGNKKVTIGVYDTFDDACLNGNDLLEKLESKFDLHTFPSGIKAKRKRFSKNGGCFGSKNTLVTQLAYLKTPFEFYASITTLRHSPIDESIDEVVESVKKYREYKLKLQEEEE